MTKTIAAPETTETIEGHTDMKDTKEEKDERRPAPPPTRRAGKSSAALRIIKAGES